MSKTQAVINVRVHDGEKMKTYRLISDVSGDNGLDERKVKAAICAGLIPSLTLEGICTGEKFVSDEDLENTLRGSLKSPASFE